MKLDRMSIVNWGALRSGNYLMGNSSLFTGPTGSGKSTLLDALQTIMTATYANIFSYNPGQDETTQSARNGKTKRTLWSYIVGAEDNLFSRPGGAHGYVAAVFRPSEGEEGTSAHVFTAVMGAAARIEGAGDRRQAVQEKFVLMIVDDVALSYEDFMMDAASGEVVPVQKIADHLKKRYPQQVTNLRDAKREYLCQLWGRFRGLKSVSFQEAEAAAKAWVGSIAHKPIGSVDDLVRHQILEHDPQELAARISQISDLMRQISGLRTEGERLQANVSRLEKIQSSAAAAVRSFETARQFQLLGARRAMAEDEKQALAAQAEITEIESEIDKESRGAEHLVHAKEALVESRIKLEASLSGIPAAEQKSRIDDSIRRSTKDLRSAADSICAGIAAAEKLFSTARQMAGTRFAEGADELSALAKKIGKSLSSLQDDQFAEITLGLKALSEADTPDPVEAQRVADLLEGLDERFAKLFEDLAGPEESLVSAVHRQLGIVHNDIKEAVAEEKEAASRKAHVVSGTGADYPSEVRTALAAFQAEFPEANAKVLCDLVEPTDDAWQPAIEGYMGGARFNLIVDKECEARAIDFVRDNRLRARIIQGTLAMRNAKPGMLHPDSIVHALSSDHPVAWAFLVDQFGGVQKVPDAETLRRTPRGLTQDGRASGSRTMFTAEARSLVFGKEAKRQSQERTEREHRKAEDYLVQLRVEEANLHKVLGAAGRVVRPSFEGVDRLVRGAKAIGSLQGDLSRIDLSEVSHIEDEAKKITEQVRGVEDQIRTIDLKIGGLRRTIEEQRATIARLDANRLSRAERIAAETTRLRQLCEANPALSFTTLSEEIERILSSNEMSQGEITSRESRARLEAQSRFGDVREALADYNAAARLEERFDVMTQLEIRDDDFTPVYSVLVTLLQRVQEQLRGQKDIGLIKNIEQLRVAEASFRDVFTKQFCYEIRNAVDLGVKTLKSLNVELDKIEFGPDKFNIDWTEWVPEYREYYDFFCAAYAMSEGLEEADLFTTTALSPEQAVVRDKLVNLLLSQDPDIAIKELTRVADYRNYRRYEIWRTSASGSRVRLSEWGTGSGGQLETPAYIVRAAVLTNRLKHFEKGASLKLLVNDESFAKMDERRAHDVIGFIRSGLGFQLLCAMPTKHAGALKSEFTKEWCFTRTEAPGNGEVDFVSEADERDINPDRMRELWDQRREEVREQVRLTFEQATPPADPSVEAA